MVYVDIKTVKLQLNFRIVSIIFLLFRHEQETKKRFKPHHIEDANGFLTVESEKLFDMLNNVFTYPRSLNLMIILSCCLNFLC